MKSHRAYVLDRLRLIVQFDHLEDIEKEVIREAIELIVDTRR